MKNDLKIKELLEQIKKQKEELGVKPRITWKTSGIFSLSNNLQVNLNVISDVQDLIEILANIIQFKDYSKASLDLLGIKNYQITLNKIPIEEYIDDIKLKYASIEWNNKKKFLSETEFKLKELISEETKTEMTLEEISTLLNKK